MNRYPVWVYVTIAAALVIGALYTLPNFFGEAPAVQVSPARATAKVNTEVLGRVEDALKKAGIQPTGVFLDQVGVKVRFGDTDTQLKAKDVVDRTLNPDATTPRTLSRSTSCRIRRAGCRRSTRCPCTWGSTC